MSHRIWRETKQYPSRARSGNQLSCCLLSLRFLRSGTVLSDNGPIHFLDQFFLDKTTEPLSGSDCIPGGYTSGVCKKEFFPGSEREVVKFCASKTSAEHISWLYSEPGWENCRRALYSIRFVNISNVCLSSHLRKKRLLSLLDLSSSMAWHFARPAFPPPSY